MKGYKVVRWSDTGENVLKTAANYTNSAYICSKFTKQLKKIEPFGPTLLGHFPLKKSDFLGIFKNVLREFHCIFSGPLNCYHSTVIHYHHQTE